MKIGILTFHYSRNYGAVLQAYALCELVKSMGHDVELIDYHNNSIVKRKSPYSFSSFLYSPITYIRRFFNSYIGHIHTVHVFKRFEQRYLPHSGRILDVCSLVESKYDCIIIGSDQVWNPSLTGGPDPFYWGLSLPKGIRIITYAVSSGDVRLMETTEFRDVGIWLERFNSISVRERRLKDYVECHSNKQVSVVLDPVLLVGKEMFDKISCQRIVDSSYILLYRVEQNSNFMDIAKKVAMLYNAKIVYVSQGSLTKMINHGGVTYKNASVTELISLIKYAECVVALSFHGTALSLLFEKDFYSVKGGNMSRVEEILMKCDLTSRIVSSPDDVKKEIINYSMVKERLDTLRCASFDWLQNALSN